MANTLNWHDSGEIQIGQVRKAVVAEARMHGFTWQQLGDTLGMSAEDAERIYGRV